MQWWIGQVTDPEKGEWADLLESTQADDKDGKDIYSHRCRVRIIGYHGCEDDLADKDLPLAHVLMPPNVSSTGAMGETMQYQGGEVVIGFFFDGEDGQQPVVFGTLFKQSFIKDEIKTSEFNDKKQTCFKPYTPPKVRQQAGKHQISKKENGNGNGGNGNGNGNGNDEVSIAFTPGEVVKTISQNQKEEATNITIDSFSPCEDNELSKITNAIKDFTRKMEALQTIGAGPTVDPIYGGIIDATAEVKRTSNLIHNSMTKLVRRGRSWLIQETLDELNLGLSEKVDKFNQVPTGQASKTLSDVIFCNIEKIMNALNDYLVKSLENMIGQVLDVPVCGVENFLGDMFGQFNNILDSTLGDMFSQLNSLTGGNMPLPSKTISKAIRFANILTNILECDVINCPEPTTFSSKNGIRKSVDDIFDNILDKAGLNAIQNLAATLDGAIAAEPSAPDCNTNVLKCGPPNVNFIGGGGQGATGSSVINAAGNIIGVAINGPGFGFTQPPLLSFVDGCDNGSGAGGYPIIGTVLDPNGNPTTGITNVVITNPGSGYLPTTTETDMDGNVTQVIPDPNGNYDGEQNYVTSLDDVIVDNTGFGYDDDDTVTVSGGGTGDGTGAGDGTGVGDGIGVGDGTGVGGGGGAEVELEITDGLITGANVVNGGFGFTDLPDLTINSDTGLGAKLIPVLKFTKVDDASQLAQISQDAVVTVISCIDK